MIRFVVLIFAFIVVFSGNASAQMSYLNKAKYITTLKVVANYKLDDSEIAEDVDKLREHKAFNQELSKMLKKIDNSKSDNAKNRRIMRILEQAGKDIYNELR